MQITFLVLENFVDKVGRSFAYRVLEDAVERYQEKISTGRALGEVFENEMVGSIINLVKVSHEIYSLVFVENGLRCTINILNSPRGDFVMHNSNTDWELRYRAIGTVDEFGIIQEFEITAFDLVDGSQSPFND
jgi:hypothetical protein